MTDAAPHRVRSEVKAPSHLYLEDFAVGQVYEAGPIPVSADAIKAYARQFDPQPFHTDEELARSTFFQGLAASGWHTASLTMSLVVEARPSRSKPGQGLVRVQTTTLNRKGEAVQIMVANLIVPRRSSDDVSPV